MLYWHLQQALVQLSELIPFSPVESIAMNRSDLICKACKS